MDRFPSVLVVEPEEFFALKLVGTLEASGIRTRSAFRADEAIGLLRNQPLDVLLTEVDLPGPMDGFSLAHRARQIRPRIGIVYSVSGIDRLLRPGRIEGAQFLLKPYPAARMLAEIGTVLADLRACGRRDARRFGDREP